MFLAENHRFASECISAVLLYPGYPCAFVPSTAISVPTVRSVPNRHVPATAMPKRPTEYRARIREPFEHSVEAERLGSRCFSTRSLKVIDIEELRGCLSGAAGRPGGSAGFALPAAPPGALRAGSPVSRRPVARSDCGSFFSCCLRCINPSACGLGENCRASRRERGRPGMRWKSAGPPPPPPPPQRFLYDTNIGEEAPQSSTPRSLLEKRRRNGFPGAKRAPDRFA
jgi:hypothetical protein